MTFAEVLSHPLWRAWAETLLHFLWQGALLGLSSAWALRFLRLRTAAQRYAVVLATLLLMAACLPITFAIVAPAVSVRQADVPSVPSTLVVAETLPADNERPIVMTAARSAVPAAMPATEEVCRWVIVGWSFGVGVLSLRIVASWIGMRLLARGRQPVSAALEGMIARLATRLGLRRVPPVCVSARVVDATVVGFLKPMVLLPAAWLVELPADMLEAVRAHELAHIRRHDLWINLLQRVIETVLFYHPAVWWISRRLRAEREMCCDELAVSVTHQRLVYVTALESVARCRTGRIKPALAVTLGDHDMALLKRIQHILGFSTTASSAGWWPAAIIALAMPAALWFGWESFVPVTKAAADENEAIEDEDRDNAARSVAFFDDDERDDDDDERNGEDRPSHSGDREPEFRPDPPKPPEGRPDEGHRDEFGPSVGRGPPGGAFRGGPHRRGEGRRPDPHDDRRRGDDDDRPDAERDISGPPRPPFDMRRRMGVDIDIDIGPRRPRGFRDEQQRERRRLRDEERHRPPEGPGVFEEHAKGLEPEGDEKLDRQRRNAGPADEMMQLLNELRHEVAQLRHEVRELRSQRRTGGERDLERGASAADDRDAFHRPGEPGPRATPPLAGVRPESRSSRDFREGRPFPRDGRRPDALPRRERPEDEPRDRGPDYRLPAHPESRPAPPNNGTPAGDSFP